jgi:NAD-dependent dihydropyrimidine dehydrogenase PreA subunit
MTDEYHGIPRKEIKWFPTIDPDRCTGCGVCVEFCHQEVFSMDGERATVSKPYGCIVGCTGCESRCESKAISFPNMRELVQELRSLRSMHAKS